MLATLFNNKITRPYFWLAALGGITGLSLILAHRLQTPPPVVVRSASPQLAPFATTSLEKNLPAESPPNISRSAFDMKKTTSASDLENESPATPRALAKDVEHKPDFPAPILHNNESKRVSRKKSLVTNSSKPSGFQITSQADGSRLLNLPDGVALPVVLSPEAKSETPLEAKSNRATLGIPSVVAENTPTTLDPSAVEYVNGKVDQIADKFVAQISEITSQGEPPSTQEWEDATYLANESFRSLVGTEEYKVRMLEAGKANLREIELARQ